jgi:hypothetical protein
MNQNNNLVNEAAMEIATNAYYRRAGLREVLTVYETAKLELAKETEDREPDLVTDKRGSEWLEMLKVNQKPQLPELPELREPVKKEGSGTLIATYRQCEFNQLITCLAAVYKHIEGK